MREDAVHQDEPQVRGLKLPAWFRVAWLLGLAVAVFVVPWWQFSVAVLVVNVLLARRAGVPWRGLLRNSRRLLMFTVFLLLTFTLLPDPDQAGTAWKVGSLSLYPMAPGSRSNWR